MGTPAEDAAFLARNAAESLPAGAPARPSSRRPRARAASCAPSSGSTRRRPTSTSGTRSCLQKLREFQDLGHRVVLIVGDYTARVGDPERPLGDAAGALGRGDRRQRPHLPGAGLPRAPATTPTCSRCASTREWLDMRMEELFRLARTTTVAQLLERDDFAKRFAARAPISILELLYPLHAGLRLGRGARRRRARRHRPDLQPAARRATSSAPTACPSRPC